MGDTLGSGLSTCKVIADTNQNRTSKKACSVMLDLYLQAPPTITERLVALGCALENIHEKKEEDSQTGLDSVNSTGGGR